MNKGDLIQAVAEAEGFTAKKAASVVNAVFEAIAQALAQGGRVELRGFGSFTVRQHQGYHARNPATGEPTEVEPSRRPFFKAGSELKLRANG